MQTIDATSIGTIAMQLESSFTAVDRAIAKLGLEPVLVLNHVRHYSDEQVERIRAQLGIVNKFSE